MKLLDNLQDREVLSSIKKWIISVTFTERSKKAILKELDNYSRVDIIENTMYSEIDLLDSIGNGQIGNIATGMFSSTPNRLIRIIEHTQGAYRELLRTLYKETLVSYYEHLLLEQNFSRVTSTSFEQSSWCIKSSWERKEGL